MATATMTQAAKLPQSIFHVEWKPKYRELADDALYRAAMEPRIAILHAHLHHAWKQLPLDARDKLLSFWLACGAPRDEFSCIPAVEVRHLPPGEGNGITLGECTPDGCTFRLHTLVVEQAPDHILRGLIAHEWGHAFSLACGGDKLGSEREADLFASSAGFPVAEIDEWAACLPPPRKAAMRGLTK